VRTYGRVYDELGNATWVEVQTDPTGQNDAVFLTTLIQTCKLSRGESPVFANYGIPAQQSVVTQVFPDFYVTQTQQQFSEYFASLIISRVPALDPIYAVAVQFNNGASVNVPAIKVPT
jgi:hypothetical protein